MARRRPAWVSTDDDGPRVVPFDLTRAAQDHLDAQVRAERELVAVDELDKMRDAQTRLGDEVRRDQARISPSVRGLPLDLQDAVRHLTEEQRAHRASRPRTRRFKALEKLDREVDGLTQRHADAAARLQAAEARLQRAPGADARTLADWIAAGEKGDRPPASPSSMQHCSICSRRMQTRSPIASAPSRSGSLASPSRRHRERCGLARRRERP